MVFGRCNRNQSGSFQTCGSRRSHLSRQGLWKLCRRSGEQVGLKCWTHQLRHTHATESYARTHDPKLIQQTLGHSDISTTMDLYVDPTDGDSSTKHLE